MMPNAVDFSYLKIEMEWYKFVDAKSTFKCSCLSCFLWSQGHLHTQPSFMFTNSHQKLAEKSAEGKYQTKLMVMSWDHLIYMQAAIFHTNRRLGKQFCIKINHIIFKKLYLFTIYYLYEKWLNEFEWHQRQIKSTKNIITFWYCITSCHAVL